MTNSRLSLALGSGLARRNVLLLYNEGEAVVDDEKR